MLRRAFVIIAFSTAMVWCAAVEAAAQPAISDHRIMVSEHTNIREIGSFLNRSFYPIRIISVDLPDSLIAGESRLFTAVVNVEHASLPITATWDFSDGTTASGLSVRHAFAQPGRYDVRLHVANRGSEASKTFSVEVQPTSNESTKSVQKSALTPR